MKAPVEIPLGRSSESTTTALPLGCSQGKREESKRREGEQ